MTAHEIISYMEAQRDDAQRSILMRFFKTAPGQYGAGDQFLGLKVPQTRAVVKAVRDDTPLSEVPALLASPWHEVRLCGLLLLADRFGRLSTSRLAADAQAIEARDALLSLYLAHSRRASNWDLVDLSAPQIAGRWLLLPTRLGDGSEAYKQHVMDGLARSTCLWQQRISIVATLTPSRQGDPRWCLRYATQHLQHPHDLMHKAVGWMLREMGKNVSMDLLRDFLGQHLHQMHRTTLRYAIEHMSPDERTYWMKS